MPKNLTELETDVNNISQKFHDIIFGNGKAGLITKVSILQWQFVSLIIMDTAIIGMLIKLIFFPKG